MLKKHSVGMYMIHWAKKRVFNAVALSANVAPVSGSLIAVLVAQYSPSTFSLLIPVTIMAKTSRHIYPLTQNIDAADA